ncbi:MAG: metallophosphoesterase family protein [Candidatus Bipolaricaulota bacterium]|nr:metallophosphoesterase family protein [Candidatus Bipolaricaulota bacterium]
MSRIGLLSDIHGNLPALDAVLAALAKETIDRIVCCGDIVGYGPWPGEVVARLREVDVRCVQGNHDAATADMLPLDYFNVAARAVIEWTQTVLPPEKIVYLRDLPQTLVEDRFVVMHGSLRGPLWEYLRDAFVAEETFSLLDRPFGFFGHSHVQGGFVDLDGRVIALDHATGQIDLLPAERYLINPGSVGQPRDGDPRAAYAIIDFAERKAFFKRVPYDIQATMQGILRAGLPSQFAERLQRGR